MRFDQEDVTVLENIACVVVGEHVAPRHGWAMFGEESDAWKECASVDWYHDMLRGNYYYVLLVEVVSDQPSHQYSRIGVGVI
jgi:hypothetical protein